MYLLIALKPNYHYFFIKLHKLKIRCRIKTTLILMKYKVNVKNIIFISTLIATNLNINLIYYGNWDLVRVIL
jgi:hypothetical protein